METWLTALASIFVAFIMSIPGILALKQQRKKEDANADNIKSNTRRTDAEIATIVQTVYQELIEDLTKKSETLKGEMGIMSDKLSNIVKQNNSLLLANEELKLSNEKLTIKVEELTSGVKLLVSQLEDEGIIPQFKINI